MGWAVSPRSRSMAAGFFIAVMRFGKGEKFLQVFGWHIGINDVQAGRLLGGR
jgi:hypothetical protein